MNSDNSHRVDTTRLQRTARAYTESAVFFAALDLELFTHVAGGKRTIQALAEATGTSELNAERLIAVCLAMGLLEPGAENEVVNAADCEKFLVKGTSRYAGPWMEFTRPAVSDWFDLAARLQDPTPPATLGMYDDLTVERARKYHEATYSIGMGAGRRFSRLVDLSNRRQLLDLGGGSGAYSINAVQSYPGLRAIVFDLPPVTVVTGEYLERNGVSDLVTTVGGDFIADPLPAGCDVAVMASNLPIYDAAKIQTVVSKTFDALEPGGEMHLIGEMLNRDGIGPLDAAMWGMAEVHFGSGGRAHSIAEVVDYFERAGFISVTDEVFVPGTLHRVSGFKGPIG